MHLARGLTTTSIKKQQEKKLTKAQQAELESGWRDRNKRLKELGLPKETIEQYTDWVYGRGKKETSKKKHSSTSSKATTYTERKTSNSTSAGLCSNTTSKREVDNGKYLSRKESVAGPCSSKPSPTYTGTQVLGIAVLHKSCLQPVFSQEEATEVARMRR